MKDLMFFDVNCRIGDSQLGPRPGVAELLADMDTYGVDRALVRHGDNAQGAEVTNAAITDMLKEDTAERLTGVWCILPSQCDEIPEPDQFFAQMKANRIGAITLNPYEHRYLPNRLTIGKIMDAAAERKVPVLLDAFSAKWQDMFTFVETFKKNTLIYIESGGKWGFDRNIRPLLENYERFYYDMAGYWVPEGIGDLALKYGTNRILFGSNFPHYSQGCEMLQLKYQPQLDEKAIAAIAGKNLENLLKEAQL